MKLPRRRFLSLAAGAATLPVASRVARAQSYPTRPSTIIVGFTPGNTLDVIARLIGQWLSERLGQPFVVENRPGAGSNISIEAVAKAAPDGYTLGMVGSSSVINATLYEKLNFNFIRDIAPVATIISQPQVMVVNPSFPAKTIPEFIAYAKANPGKINMASGGEGTGSHLAGELFKIMAGVEMVHVPYRGQQPALTDTASGKAHVIFEVLRVSIESIRTGKLRAMGVTTAGRSELLPGVPAVGEFVPGYEVSGFLGVGAPKNTSAEIINKLNKEINAGLADPRIKARLADLGGQALALSPAEFAKLIAEETEKWGNVIRTANIKRK